MYTNSSRSYLKMASGTPRRTNGTPWRTGGTPTAEYSDSRREYVKYLLNGGYESINDIEFRKRLNQYHSAED